MLFCIGTPDARASEFGATKATWRGYKDVFPEPVTYTVGKSRVTDWPYIHPSHNDRWADNRPHPFTIHFQSRESHDIPLYLTIGIADAHNTEPSTVTVEINGTVLKEQAAPLGASALVDDPRNEGRSQRMVFAIPAGAVSSGENTLAITLRDGSMIVYDYVALDTQPVPPLQEVRQRQIANILQEPDFDFDEIVFAERMPGLDFWGKPGHYYANFGRFAYEGEHPTRPGELAPERAFGDGGRLCRLNIRTGEMTILLEDERGGVRDPQVHYDGRKILFSYRKGGEDEYHLYEIDGDGTGLRQLTDGPFNDFEPTYLPDGDIVFVSSRCNRWVNCWLTEVAVLYRCDADGNNIRMLSSNNEHDNTPSVLPDGRLLYTRWEYVDRSQVHYHHLWTVNPDGTSQMVYYGNMRPGVVMIDAKPVPGTRKVVSVFSPGHGRSEHAGQITMVDVRLGPDEPGFAEPITAGRTFRDPYPLTENWFLAAETESVLLIDRQGTTWPLYEIPEAERTAKKWISCNEPVPLRKRPRERIIPARTNPSRETGTLVLADVNYGRNMEGVAQGEIKKLLVLETLPKPINFTGGMEPLSYGGTFTLERILGTIPVEPDGSAYAELPAMRSLFFVALDESDLSVKRMQSFLTLQPGEQTSCAGCHEHRSLAPQEASASKLMALQRPPSRPEPIDGIPDVIDFARDIQPIFNRNCVQCHNYERREGDVVLTGDRGPFFTHSYYTLIARNQIVDGRNLPKSSLTPRSIGSAASPLMDKIRDRHHGVKLSERESSLIRLWIETGAPTAGTYAALGSGMFGGYWINRLDRQDLKWPSMKAAMNALERRCSSCHKDRTKLAMTPSDDLGKQPWVPLTPEDPRRRFSRHLLYNLTDPDRSLMLLAPLAQNAGGYADESGHAVVFEDTNDPDYQRLLLGITETKQALDKTKRYDMPGFRPRPEYIREMQRYGILPETLESGDPVDYYAADRAYWRSFWHRPTPKTGKIGFAGSDR